MWLLRLSHISDLEYSLGIQPAGNAWLGQWSVSKPRTGSTAWIPRVRRSGKQSAMIPGVGRTTRGCARTSLARQGRQKSSPG